MLDPRVPVAVLDKPTRSKGVGPWVTKNLMPTILELTRNGVEIGSVGLTLPVKGDGLKLFELSTDEALRASDTQIRSLRRDAYLAVEPWVNGIFEASSAQWIAIACSEHTLLVARWGDEMSTLSQAEVHQLELGSGHPVMVVGRPPQMEEISTGHWNECQFGDLTNDLYPSISIEINGVERGFHFDTGSSQSFVAFDLVEGDQSVGSYRSLPWEYSRMNARGRSAPFEYARSPLTMFRVPQGDGSVELIIPFHLVLDWRETPISLECEKGECVGSIPLVGGAFVCGKRSGLIGRDILRVNPEMRLILDCKERRTTILIGDEEVKRKFFKR